MYAAVVGMYTLKQNTNADIANGFAHKVLIVAGLNFRQYFLLASPLCAVLSRE
jgi:hypothetical protein